MNKGMTKYIDKIVIHPTGGLCNKLRATLSYYFAAKKENKRLIVIWDITEACPGFFLDYFEPIENVYFLKENSQNLELDYNDCGWHPDFCPYNVNIFRELKLLSTMMNEVNEKILLLENDYIAIHVRRTDHAKLAKLNNCYTSDEDFFNFIDKSRINNIYIATDNKETFNLFYGKYNNRIKTLYTSDLSLTALRETSFKDAIIDLYTCVYSKEFKGSGYSSFSSTIEFIKACI